MQKVTAEKTPPQAPQDRVSERESIELRLVDATLPPVITGGARRC